MIAGNSRIAIVTKEGRLPSEQPQRRSRFGTGGPCASQQDTSTGCYVPLVLLRCKRELEPTKTNAQFPIALDRFLTASPITSRFLMTAF